MKKKNKKKIHEPKPFPVLEQTGLHIKMDIFFKYIGMQFIFHMPSWRPMYRFWVLTNFRFHVGYFAKKWFLLFPQTAAPSTKERAVSQQLQLWQL